MNILSRVVGASFLATLLASISAEAQESQFGPWKFTAGVVPNGSRFCGMTSVTSDGNDKRSVTITVTQGQNRLLVTAVKASWNFFPRAHSEMAIWFSNNNSQFIGSGYPAAERSGHEVTIPVEDVINFRQKIASSTAMRIGNRTGGAPEPEGLDPGWIISLEGAKAAYGSVFECEQNDYQPPGNESALGTAQGPQFRPWEFTTGTTPNGAPTCGMTSAMGDGNDRRTVTVYSIRGKEGLFLQASKGSWNIPKGMQSELVLGLGQDELKFPASGNANNVVLSFKEPLASVVVGSMRSFPVLVIKFPQGSEPEWAITTKGVSASSKSLAECINNDFRASGDKNVTPNDGRLTQPFGYGR